MIVMENILIQKRVVTLKIEVGLIRAAKLITLRMVQYINRVKNIDFIVFPPFA